MADKLQGLTEDEVLDTENAIHEEVPTYTPEEEFEREKRKITITKKGIYSGENYDTIYEFISQEYLDSKLSSINKELADNVLLYSPDIDETQRKNNSGYSQEQTDSLLTEKADAEAVYTKAETYSQSELKNLLGAKADFKNTYTKVDSDRSYLKIKDLPFATNPKVQNPTITDLNAASQNPFGQDLFLFTQEEYDALSDEAKLNNKLYIIVDGTTDELLGSSKPALVANQTKAVLSGGTLRLDFTMYPQTTLNGSIINSSFQGTLDNYGNLEVHDNYAIFTAPVVTQDGFVILGFRGVRNNMQSQRLDVVIAIGANAAENKFVSFDGNGAVAGSMSAITIPKTGENWILTLPDCLYTGDYNLEFAGWSTSTTDETGFLGNAGERVEFDNPNPTTLYAIWKQKENTTVTITYDANGGYGEMAQDVTSTRNQDGYSVKKCNFAAPEGKVFVMWSTDKYGNGSTCLPGDTLTFSFSRNLYLYAIWKAPSENIFVKPIKPVLVTTGLPKKLVEGQSFDYIFTGIATTNQLFISTSTDLKNNKAEVFGDIVRVTALYGSVSITIFVYQRSQYGVDSDIANWTITIEESQPPKLATNSALSALIGETIEIEFENLDKSNVLEINNDAPSEVQIAGNKITLTSLTEKDISFSVVQVKTARNGQILKSEPLELTCKFTANAETEQS